MSVGIASSVVVTITPLVGVGWETDQGCLWGTRSNPEKERVPKDTFSILRSVFDEPEYDMIILCHITPRMHNKLTRLVGPKCLVSCNIGKQPAQALWDTGSSFNDAQEMA